MMRIRNGQLLASGPEPAEPPDAVGVFETLLLRTGAPQFFAEHCQRHAAGCAHFGLDTASDAGTLRTAVDTLVAVNGISDGVLRWSTWRETNGSVNWQVGVEPPRPHMAKPAWSAVCSITRLPPPGPDAAHKHLGRRIWREALLTARAQGFDEVLLMDRQGRIVEGGVSNVFWVAGGVVRTPSLACGPLPGITRAQVIAVAREVGLPAEESLLTLADVHAAQELFVTNALVGIRPLAALDGVPKADPAPVTARLQAAWRAAFGWS